MLNQIKLYGVIGEDVTAVQVKQQIDAMDQTQPLVVRIHSEGGSVPDGLAIYDALQAYAGPKKAIIESAAFSIASHIAMAFEDVEITENGYLMIHNPHMDVSGDDSAHTQAADVLNKMKTSMVEAYKRKTGKSEEEVLSVMAKETWINAKEALASGYVNRITQPKSVRIAARSMNIPKGVIESLSGDTPKPQPTKDETMSQEPVAATVEEIEARFPTMKPERILACIKRKLPLASVMTEALSAMEEEMTALKAKLAEYEMKAATEVVVETEPSEEEVAAKAMEEEEMQAKVKAEEEVKMQAKAKAGVKPVAKARGPVGGVSAKAKWDSAISAKVENGIPKAKAASLVNKENPGLREQMLDEVNAQ